MDYKDPDAVTKKGHSAGYKNTPSMHPPEDRSVAALVAGEKRVMHVNLHPLRVLLRVFS